MTAPDVIVFDVDGVLVDVSASYREAIRATVKHFTDDEVSNDLIQKFKNQGGWNNDWELSYRLILDRGRNVEYNDVVDQFNRLFFGNNGDGLILNEKWFPRNGFFDTLRRNSLLAIFTGRVRYELTPTLARFAREIPFEPSVTADDVENQKPAPDGLQSIQARYAGKSIWYVGDTVDDARAAKGAGVPFVGIAAKDSPRYSELADALRREGAFIVLENVNEMLDLIEESRPAMREASIERITKETQIRGSLRIEGTGIYRISTGVRFLDHMLELFTKHGAFDLTIDAAGDLDVDQHHTVEDVGIALGDLFSKALGDRRGINRAGYFVQTMDETLAVVAVDLGGRSALIYDQQVNVTHVGDLQTELLEDFFGGFVNHAGANLHAKIMHGRSNHHKIEAIFKCFARAMRYACSTDERLKDQLPSTKGLL